MAMRCRRASTRRRCSYTSERRCSPPWRCWWRCGRWSARPTSASHSSDRHRHQEPLTMTEPVLVREQRGAVLVLRLNRPDARNALSPELIGELGARSEEHTSELQSLMRISYAVFCLKKKKTNQT